MKRTLMVALGCGSLVFLLTALADDARNGG